MVALAAVLGRVDAGPAPSVRGAHVDSSGLDLNPEGLDGHMMAECLIWDLSSWYQWPFSVFFYR